MIDEQLLREYINSYPLHIEKDTFEKFREQLYASAKGKLSTRKKNIFLTAEKTSYPFNGMRVTIKTKTDNIPCYLSFSFNYDKLKNGLGLYFIYNLVKFQPSIFPFSVPGDDYNITYQTVIPFMIWMSEEDQYLTYDCREDYRAIITKDKERLKSVMLLEGEEYITNVKEYCGARAEKRYKIVIEARVAAMKMMDRFIEFMEEIA